MGNKIIYRMVDGKVEKEEVERILPDRTAQNQAYASGKPLTSRSVGYQPEQVAEVREFLKKRGVRGVDVTDTGRVEFRTRSGRRDYNIATATCDGDAGYGDFGGR